MNTGIVRGKVICTQKSAELAGIALKIIERTDRDGKICGKPIVAVDAIGARDGDRVLWVEKREASMAIPKAQIANLNPVDAAIVGIIDAVS